MFQKPLQRVKILHGVDKFGQIFQPPRGIRGFVQLPHLGIARLIQHHAGKISVMHLPGLVAPTLYIFNKISQRVTRRGSQFIRVNQIHRRRQKRFTRSTRLNMNRLQTGSTQAAFWQINDAFKRQIIC